jgi:hypothetical protein
LVSLNAYIEMHGQQNKKDLNQYKKGRRKEGRKYEWMDGWMGGWMDVWTGGRYITDWCKLI